MSDSVLQYSLNFPNLFLQQTADTFKVMIRGFSKPSLRNFLRYVIQERTQTIDQIQKGYDEILKVVHYEMSEFLTDQKESVQQQLIDLNKKQHQLSQKKRLFKLNLKLLQTQKKNVSNEGILNQREINKSINDFEGWLEYTIKEIGICSKQSNIIKQIINLLDLATLKIFLIRAKQRPQRINQYGLVQLQEIDYKKKLRKFNKLMNQKKLKKSASINVMRVISNKSKDKKKQSSNSTQKKILRDRSLNKKQSSKLMSMRERTNKSLKKYK